MTSVRVQCWDACKGSTTRLLSLSAELGEWRGTWVLHSPVGLSLDTASNWLSLVLSHYPDAASVQGRQLLAGLEKVNSDLDKQEKAITANLRPPLEQSRAVQDSTERSKDLKVHGCGSRQIVLYRGHAPEGVSRVVLSMLGTHSLSPGACRHRAMLTAGGASSGDGEKPFEQPKLMPCSWHSSVTERLNGEKGDGCREGSPQGVILPIFQAQQGC